MSSWKDIWSSSTWTEAIVVIVCAVDAADKALLPATFHALEIDLAVGPAQLGQLNFCQSLAFSLTLPFWGVAMSKWSARDLLAAGCCLWGSATGLLALSFNFHVHCVLRLLNGAALSGVMPIAQAVLCDLVPEDQRGASFGRLQACTNLAGMITSFYALTLQDQSQTALGESSALRGWQYAYLQCAFWSFIMAAVVLRTMRGDIAGASMQSVKGNAGPARSVQSCWQPLAVAKAILRIPTFMLLVFQGVSGGVPWNAMAFMTLYWQACGFSNWQAGVLSAVQGIAGAIGSVLGGRLGDAAARISADRGRMAVALSSVVLGVPLFVLLVRGLGRDPSWFMAAALVLFLFGLCSCWTGPAANRPICAELVNSPSERAQIVALWVMIEGISASIFGAPLVGWLSERFGYRLARRAADGVAADATSAQSLADAMTGVAVVSWAVCAAAWIMMFWTFPVDRLRAKQQQRALEMELT